MKTRTINVGTKEEFIKHYSSMRSRKCFDTDKDRTGTYYVTDTDIDTMIGDKVGFIMIPYLCIIDSNNVELKMDWIFIRKEADLTWTLN